MRKNIYTFLAVAFAAGLLAGCGSKDSGKDTTIVVGASPAPHAEILEAAKPVLEKAGYTLEIKEYNDYVQPNVALDAGDLDANYFQHQPYLDEFNAEKKTELASAAVIHYDVGLPIPRLMTLVHKLLSDGYERTGGDFDDQLITMLTKVVRPA